VIKSFYSGAYQLLIVVIKCANATRRGYLHAVEMQSRLSLSLYSSSSIFFHHSAISQNYSHQPARWLSKECRLAVWDHTLQTWAEFIPAVYVSPRLSLRLSYGWSNICDHT